LIDLRVAEPLAVRRRRAGRRIDLDEFIGLGIEATELAGPFRHPGIARRIRGGVVRLGEPIDEIIGHRTILQGLAGQQFPRQTAVGIVGLFGLEIGGEIIRGRRRLLVGDVGDVRDRHVAPHPLDECAAIPPAGSA